MAGEYISQRHDIGVTNAAGSVIGMMIAQDKTGTPRWTEIDDEFLAQQFFTGDAGYANLPAEKELAMRQDDWRGGFGLEFFSGDEPSRYHRSFGMDLRFKNMGILGPKATAVQKPTVASSHNFLNLNMESTTGWTGGSRSTYQKQAGSYSRRVTENTTATQSASNWSNNWRNNYISVSGYKFGISTVTSIKVRIYDGVLTSCTTATAAEAWTSFSLSSVLAQTADRFQIKLSAAAGGDGFFDTFSIVGKQKVGPPKVFADFNDKLYLASGNMISRLSTLGSTFNTMGSVQSTISSLEPFADNRLYIANSTAYPYKYMSTAEVMTEATAAAKLFRLFRTVHSSSPTMWANDGNRTIRSNTNPINGGTAWSGQTNVGTNYYAITDLLTQSGALYIMKEDMPFYLSATGVPQSDLAPELVSLIATTSGKNAFAWKNKIYIPCGAQGLLETDGTNNTFIQPTVYGNNVPEFVGRVMAVTGDDQYLFIAVDYGSYAYVLAGREEIVDGAVGWRWHPICTLTISGVNYMHVSNVYQKRLWIAGSSTADSIYYIPLPTGYGNIVADSNRKFTTEGYFYTPYLHGNFRDTPKAFPLLELNLGHSYSTKKYFTAYYEMQGSTKQTYIGKFVGTASNRSPQKYLRDTTAATPLHPMSRAMRLKIHAHTTTDTGTPILLGYKLKGILYPPRRKIIACTVRVSNEIASKMGLRPESHYDMVKTALDDAIAATWPVSIRDIDGNTQTVKFMPLPGNVPRVQLIKDEAGRVQERHYNVLMMVVNTNATAGGTGDSSTAA